MDEFKEPYLILFRAVRDAIKAIEAQNYGTAKELLVKGEQQAEEAYLCMDVSANIS